MVPVNFPNHAQSFSRAPPCHFLVHLHKRVPAGVRGTSAQRCQRLDIRLLWTEASDCLFLQGGLSWTLITISVFLACVGTLPFKAGDAWPPKPSAHTAVFLWPSHSLLAHRRAGLPWAGRSCFLSVKKEAKVYSGEEKMIFPHLSHLFTRNWQRCAGFSIACQVVFWSRQHPGLKKSMSQTTKARGFLASSRTLQPIICWRRNSKNQTDSKKTLTPAQKPNMDLKLRLWNWMLELSTHSPCCHVFQTSTSEN